MHGHAFDDQDRWHDYSPTAPTRQRPYYSTPCPAVDVVVVVIVIVVVVVVVVVVPPALLVMFKVLELSKVHVRPTELLIIDGPVLLFEPLPGGQC